MSILNDQARFAAKSVGIVLVRFQEGFYLFSAKDGEQLGLPEEIYEPWTAEEVLRLSRDFTGREGGG